MSLYVLSSGHTNSMRKTGARAAIRADIPTVVAVTTNLDARAHNLISFNEPFLMWSLCASERIVCACKVRYTVYYIMCYFCGFYSIKDDGLNFAHVWDLTLNYYTFQTKVRLSTISTLSCHIVAYATRSINHKISHTDNE